MTKKVIIIILFDARVVVLNLITEWINGTYVYYVYTINWVLLQKLNILSSKYYGIAFLGTCYHSTCIPRYYYEILITAQHYPTLSTYTAINNQDSYQVYNHVKGFLHMMTSLSWSVYPIGICIQGCKFCKIFFFFWQFLYQVIL